MYMYLLLNFTILQTLSGFYHKYVPYFNALHRMQGKFSYLCCHQDYFFQEILSGTLSEWPNFLQPIFSLFESGRFTQVSLYITKSLHTGKFFMLLSSADCIQNDFFKINNFRNTISVNQFGSRSSLILI